MIIASTALALLLTTCSPEVAPSTMAAIVAVESAGNPYALNDNTAHRSYVPRDAADALATAQALILRGHSADIGIAQVNSGNFAAFHTTSREMLDPCPNLRVASRILAGDYADARRVFAEPGQALWHAISAYNTGSLYAGKRYVDRVIAAANRAALVPSINLLADRPAIIAARPSTVVVATAPSGVHAKVKAPISSFSRVLSNPKRLAVAVSP